jgi:RHH-type transcriptional regulator, rel operon repressor / antitoxin RelB
MLSLSRAFFIDENFIVIFHSLLSCHAVLWCNTQRSFAMDGVKETISFRLDPSLKAALDEVGAALDRDRTWIINDALRAYLEAHHWQLKQIDQAIAGADRGEFATEEEVKAAFEAWRSE